MDLFDLTPNLQRAVAPPGEFATYFPDANDNDLAGILADSLAEAQLDGFMSTVLLADETLTTPDLTAPQQALVLLYARARIITARLANLRNHTRYKAGNVEAETEQSASVLVAILKDTSDRKKQILDDAKYGVGTSNFAMADLYVTKSLGVQPQDIGWFSLPGAW